MPDTTEHAIVSVSPGTPSDSSQEDVPTLSPDEDSELGSSQGSDIDDFSPSGSHLIYLEGMPSLETLLKQNRVAYTILERTVSLRRTERWIWIGLASLSLLWGLITGLSFAVEGFPVHPATSVLGCLVLGVLSVTTWLATRQASDQG